MNTFQIVQILGIVTLIFYVFSLQMKKKENLLVMQIVSNVTFALQYILTLAWTGATMAAIAVIRGIVFYIFKKKKIKPSIIALLIFEIAMIISTILTWESALSLLPLIGMSVSLLGQWQDNMKWIRISTIIGATFWLGYELSAGLYTAVLTELCNIASSMVGLWRFRKSNGSYATKGKII